MDRGYMSSGGPSLIVPSSSTRAALRFASHPSCPSSHLALYLTLGKDAQWSDERLDHMNIGILCCIAVMLTMEIIGGMHSVVLTDIVQAIIMLFGFAMLAIVKDAV